MDLLLLLWALSAIGVVLTTRRLDPEAPRLETWLLAVVPLMNTLLVLSALMLMFVKGHQKRGL